MYLVHHSKIPGTASQSRSRIRRSRNHFHSRNLEVGCSRILLGCNKNPEAVPGCSKIPVWVVGCSKIPLAALKGFKISDLNFGEKNKKHIT